MEYKITKNTKNFILVFEFHFFLLILVIVKLRNKYLIHMSDKHIDNETMEMLTSFVSEAVDSLDTAEPLVEELKTADDPEVINTIFRVFHTLKGLSGFFGMKIINALTHEAETLLDILRKEKIKVTEDLVTLIYSTFDLLRDLLHLVSNEFTDEAGADDAENMKIIIKDAIEKIKTGSIRIIYNLIIFISSLKTKIINPKIIFYCLYFKVFHKYINSCF